ncbi:MAG TPA: NADPH-dependent FMN reductase [Acidimicrobiaceae bacterium]|jgi:chromate reductase, NAD(P)H dehydrogenase (quinone)|nr:NADPH-dependent FMN reductase [Actinomycetota bacterium]HAN08034.1 NADPH-dependent FMN reductase [Acidimicrobiaceae bacterium]
MGGFQRMAEILKVMTVSGSLRKKSVHSALAQHLTKSTYQCCEFQSFEINTLPLFNEDLEQDGYPIHVASWQQSCREVDAVIFLTPEYNQGIPGTLKNAVDWLSRPYGSEQYRKLSIGVVNGVPGQSPGRYAAANLLHSLSQLSDRVFEQPLLLTQIYDIFEDTELTSTTAELIKMWTINFLRFTETTRANV